MNYAVIDVETANSDQSSICQIGIVTVRRGEVSGRFRLPINPLSHFDPGHIRLHGIEPEHVGNASTFAQFHSRFAEPLSTWPILHYSSFDKVAFEKAEGRFGLDPSSFEWVDVFSIARACLPGHEGGHSLKNLCESFGIDFQHHDALEDALAAHALLNVMLDRTGTDLAFWRKQLSSAKKKPLPQGSLRNLKGNSHGKWQGCTIVFSGNLSGLTRAEAQRAAQAIGFNTANAVTGKTTHLCVSDAQIASGATTAKMEKVVVLADSGQDVEIISEATFISMIS